MSIVISLVIIAVCVFLLAIITEDFFIISLDVLSNKLKLPSDVAGASLMAMGSSAPELFIALLSVFRGGEHSDVGIGTIVGSAIFNILVITGVSAIVANKMAMIRGAVERDIIFYLGSIALLLYVFWDGTILFWEAGMMIVAYTGYLIVLWVWSRTNPEDVLERPPQEKKVPHESKNAVVRLSDVVARVFEFITRDPKDNYIWTLIVSIAAIAGLSWVLVEYAVVLSNALGIPAVIVSLTLLAAGTSAPDLIASMNVAQDGRGAMSVANAVGSNIFDILVGLGVPWMITIIALHPTVEVGTDGLIISVFLLSVTTIVLYIALNTGRVLTRREGWVLLFVYAVYVGYVVATSL